MRFIVTTEVGVERLAAGRINDVPSQTTELQESFGGLLIVEADMEDAATELAKIPEINNILPVEVECPAEIDAIANVGGILACEKIPKDKTFAVDTVRRGEHDFTSIDVIEWIWIWIWIKTHIAQSTRNIVLSDSVNIYPINHNASIFNAGNSLIICPRIYQNTST